jgi:hypothetical protein
VVKWPAFATLVAALLAGLGGACALLDDDPPKNECETSMDCFRAQGEGCNPETHECELHLDAGIHCG